MIEINETELADYIKEKLLEEGIDVPLQVIEVVLAKEWEFMVEKGFVQEGFDDEPCDCEECNPVK